MKKLIALALISMGSSFVSHAQQVGSDDPIYFQNSNAKALPTTSSSVSSMSVTGTTFPCGGGTDTLFNNGSCGSLWSSDSLATNIIGTTDTLVFGPINSDTTIYFTSFEGNQDSIAPLPPHGSNFSGNVRGYYFTAPIDMVITGLWVPTNANSGTQNVEVLLFDNQTAPPLWSNTTNAFTSLGYWPSFSATDTIDVCFAISAGDVVGIYGTRNDVNSYASGPYQSMIGGIPVTFTRTGMQMPLSTNQMMNVFSEAGGSISRTEFFYDINPTLVTSPVSITVPQPSFATSSASICQGDSILVGGTYQSSAGVYSDSLLNSFGCDSIIETTLTVIAPSFLQTTAAICQGDSIFVGGGLQYTAGVYLDSLQTVNGCDSIVETNLVVNALPSVTFTGDTVCLEANAFTMNGSPVGGTYSGNGVSGNMFDPSATSLGTETVTYSIVDSAGCSNSVAASFIIESCAGISEIAFDGVSVYPNPATDFIDVVLTNNLDNVTGVLYDAKGKIVQSWILSKGTNSLNIESLSSGIYILNLENTVQQSVQYRIVKK